MTFDDYLKDKREEVVSILSIHLQSKAAKTSITLIDFIQTLKARGLSNETIKGQLYADIKDGGRIFGEFFNSLNADVRGALNQMAHSAKLGRIAPSPKQLMMWEVESDNPCPDCLRRNGSVDTFENWQVRGLPGTGWSVCRENCLCNLIKAEKMQATA